MGLGGVLSAVLSPRAARKARKAEKAAAHAREAAARRAQEQFAEDTETQRQELSQSFSSRGVSPNSSIYGETMGRYERARARGAAGAQEAYQVARLSRRALAAQQTIARNLGPFQMFDDIISNLSGAKQDYNTLTTWGDQPPLPLV